MAHPKQSPGSYLPCLCLRLVSNSRALQLLSNLKWKNSQQEAQAEMPGLGGEVCVRILSGDEMTSVIRAVPCSFHTKAYLGE